MSMGPYQFCIRCRLEHEREMENLCRKLEKQQATNQRLYLRVQALEARAKLVPPDPPPTYGYQHRPGCGYGMTYPAPSTEVPPCVCGLTNAALRGSVDALNAENERLRGVIAAHAADELRLEKNALAAMRTLAADCDRLRVELAEAHKQHQLAEQARDEERVLKWWPERERLRTELAETRALFAKAETAFADLTARYERVCARAATAIALEEAVVRWADSITAPSEEERQKVLLILLGARYVYDAVKASRVAAAERAQLVPPDPPPRYDDVFEEGVRALDRNTICEECGHSNADGHIGRECSDPSTR